MELGSRILTLALRPEFVYILHAHGPLHVVLFPI